MTKYILIPDAFSGNIAFYYDAKGLLVEFQINSWDMAPEHKVGMLQHLSNCLCDSDFVEWAKARKYKVRREEVDLSFERFYGFYGVARDRHITEPLWNRLTERERYNTLLNLKGYKRYVARNPKYAQMAPKTYLRSHRGDNWDKVPDLK